MSIAGKLTRLSLLSLCLALLSPAHARILDDDPVIGTWELDVERSRFLPGVPRRPQTRIYELHPDGISTTIISRDASGAETVSHYIGSYDSVPSPLYGNKQVDEVFLESVDSHTARAELLYRGFVVATAERRISEDGQRMTITVRTRGNAISHGIYNRMD